MIVPYDEALRMVEPEFRALGFSLSSDSAYGARFSLGSVAVELSTERYYQPSISTTFIDSRGKRFHLGMLEEIIDPELSAKHQAQFDDLSLDDVRQSTEDEQMQYALIAFRAAVELFSKHAERILHEPQSYEPQYAKLESSLLAALSAPRGAT